MCIRDRHVHDEVQDDGKLGNNLVGGLHGRHDHEHDGKQGDDAALNEQDGRGAGEDGKDPGPASEQDKTEQCKR